MAAILEIEEITDQQAFNLARWNEVCADPKYLTHPDKIETNRHGHVIMTPPPGFYHGKNQITLGSLLRDHLKDGISASECPVSTSAGVRAPDVVWVSNRREHEHLENGVFLTAPEICIEILSPSNTRGEIDQKRALYFEAGAEEVWILDLAGNLFFFVKTQPEIAAENSLLAPNFPNQFS